MGVADRWEPTEDWFRESLLEDEKDDPVYQELYKLYFYAEDHFPWAFRPGYSVLQDGNHTGNADAFGAMAQLLSQSFYNGIRLPDSFLDRVEKNWYFSKENNPLYYNDVVRLRQLPVESMPFHFSSNQRLP